MTRIACVVPTYNGRRDLARLLDSLEGQTAEFDTFIVDSSSKDGTLELARERVSNVTVIPSGEFNHGGTRQLMIDRNPGYDIYVYLTQDACLAEKTAIEQLVKPFSDPRVGAVCGRQLPHLDATPLAQHARLFNYPDGIQVKVMADAPSLGIKTAFMSNSFAAYRSAALKAAGGFPVHVIFAEDMYATAKMLMQGWKVAYAGDAQCRHSHNYTLMEEFKRYFDMGVFHAREPWIRENFGGAGGEGLRYVKSELSFLGLGRFYLWPSAMVRNAVKLAGYKLGQKDARLPIHWKRKLGMYRRYWDGPFA
ncbi:rhamnosyltransferase [Malikia spinosa]|uniref:Rhamnosyltransferase n=1 Tax=Malikia spinosa TaxID=86180 RepID=A0A2S9KDR0_9BURK|nr:glycosyltransferase [Malikia spinosa]PRD68578.1 rhamnosyltransferase [Malikia spinosa]